MTRFGCVVALLGLIVSGAMGATTDPYQAWSQGRPSESVQALIERAESHDTWHAWYDAGLCAASADQPGLASQALLEAHRRAPLRTEPLQALRTVGSDVPRTRVEHLGWLVWPARGWPMLIVSVLAGLAGGLAIMVRPWRGALVTVTVVGVLAVTPGLIAGWLDQREAVMTWRVVHQSVWLEDSTGEPLAAVSAGDLVQLATTNGTWNERVLVQAGEQRGLIDRHVLEPLPVEPIPTNSPPVNATPVAPEER